MSFKQKQILMKIFVKPQFEFFYVYEFQTKVNSHEDICWNSVSSFVSLSFSNKSEFLWRHLLSLSFKLFKFTSFKQNLILIRTFVESQFEILQVYEFQTKANSFEDICWVSVWRYVSLCLSNKSKFWRGHILGPCFKLRKFMNFKKKRILMKAFVKAQFRVMLVYQFHTNGNSFEDICWVSVWSYVSLWVSNKSEFLWRHWLDLSLKLCKFTSFNQKRILVKIVVEPRFEVI